MNKISLFLAMFLFSGIANAEMLNSKHIYSFAKSGDYSSLERYSRWIDITNSDGDTAVCLAIKNNDVNSYNLLLNYGANSRPNCYAKAIKSVSGSAKSGTFLGMSGTGWAVTGGVLAAGGIAAAAGGGGGGGGSSSSQPSPVICSNQGSLVEGVCQCNTGYSGSQCEKCDDGYIKYNGSCYQKLSCANGLQKENECVCDAGYAGSLCNEADENHIIGSDGNLYDKLNCVNGNQVNASCNCAEGWEGATCETAASCGYDTIECAYGYKETNNTCKSGNTTYKECVFDDENFIQQGGNVYPKLDCKNGGVQEASTCNCVEGWDGATCETAAACGYDTIECAYGYKETGSTCKSGNTTYKKCVFDDENFIQQDGNVYPKLECKNGGVQEANTCNCVDGWTGTLCDTPVDCGTNYKETCASNEYTTEETCTSGGNNLKKCLVHSEMPNCQTLSSTSDTCEICKTGYAGTTCSQAADGYTLFDDIAYPTLACANGSTQDKDHCTCEDGWTGTLCNTPADCDYTTTSCLTGYKTTGNSCKSGEAIYVECVFDDENFIQQDGNVYPKLECKNGGTQLGNSCNCSKGYSGTFCQTVCNTVDEDGNCIKVITTNKTNKSTIKATNNDKSITLYGMKGEVYAYNAYGDTKGDSGTNGTITLINKNAGDVYGMYSGIYATNTHVGYPNNISGLIDIKNTNSGNVYGIYSDGQGVNVEGYAAGTYDTGIIRINNVNSGDAYGIYVTKSSGISANYAANSSGGGLAIIEITNRGNNNIYGIYSGDTAVNNGIANGYGGQGIIKINNIGNGDIYGIFAEYSAYNTSVSKNSHYTGTIKIKNQGNGKVYGISAEYSENNSNDLIQIISNGITNSYGMYGTSYNRNFGTIQIVQNDDGLAVGQYGSGYILDASYTSGRIYNKGTIKIYNLSNGVAVGIYANYANVENLGDIIITRADFTDDNLTEDTADDITYSAATETGGTAIGIYGAKGTTITNTGTITINNAANAYGIWSEGGTVTNTGTITIDGESQTNDSTANGKHIVLNGGTLFQNGKLVAKQTADTASSSSDATSESKKINNYVLNLNDMGGKVVATEKAVFEVHGAIAGHLTMSSDIVSKGFKDTYTTNGTIDAEDTSGLCLVSQSALFNASLAENNSDVVMKMKAFNEVVDNQSLAGFLQNNYALENNESFFNTLKKQETVTSLNDALGDLSGKKLFSRFADEDLTMMRELTFDVNNKLFMNNDDHLETSGNVSTFNFRNNKGSDNRYALISQNYGNYQLGLNYGFANVRSDDDDNNRRNERMFHVGMPISYGKQGFKFITTPHLGYSSGTYNRKGFNNENYEGNVEKTMFGLVNEARYPFALGKWTVAPGAEFNVVDYRTQGHEKGGTYKLRLAAQNNYSVEAGVGLYANAEHKFSEKSKLTFTNGLTMYHEFADPYKMQVGVCGMSGEFNIRDEKRSDNRAVIRTGLSYVNDNISLSGNVMSYIDKEYRTNAVLDFKYAF